MFEDDDLPRPKPARLMPPVLDPLAIDDLRLYIEELRAEISRVEAAIARKQAVRDAAGAFFKSG